MDPNTKELLSVLQQEFRAKLNEYNRNQSTTVSKIQMNMPTMRKYAMEPKDHIQLGPFSCREILAKLEIDDYEISDDNKKAVIFGFLADTFSERGFDVNIYNVVPETGEVQVQNLKPAEKDRRPALQLSRWDKFWGFFGIETENAKAIKGYEEAKKNEAKFAEKLKNEVEKRSAEVKKTTAVVPADTSKYTDETARMFEFLEKGAYSKAVLVGERILQKEALKNADAEIKANIIDNDKVKDRKKADKLKPLRDLSANVFAKKFYDKKYTALSDMDKALTLANIIKTPDKMEEICKIKMTSTVNILKKPKAHTNKQEFVEKPYYVFDFKNSPAALTDYIPDLSEKLSVIQEEDPIIEDSDNEL